MPRIALLPLALLLLLGAVLLAHAPTPPPRYAVGTVAVESARVLLCVQAPGPVNAVAWQTVTVLPAPPEE